MQTILTSKAIPPTEFSEPFVKMPYSRIRLQNLLCVLSIFPVCVTSQVYDRESGSLSFDKNLNAKTFDALVEVCFQKQFGGLYGTWLKHCQEDEATFRQQRFEKESELKSRLEDESNRLEATLRDGLIARILALYPYGLFINIFAMWLMISIIQNAGS